MADIHNLDNPLYKVREAGAVFYPVVLPPPENWVPGPQLFPYQVIAGYNADYKDYNADTWAKYILEKAEGFDQATSCSSCSGGRFFLLGLIPFDVQNWLDVIPAINSGTPKDRFWFGYVFRGGHVTVADFKREEGVEGCRAFR